MYDPELVISILQQIQSAARTILERFQPISKVQDFTHSEAGKEKLDAICMQLIAIGESLKKSILLPPTRCFQSTLKLNGKRLWV